ncbi:MAG: hypothetical protein JRN15_13300 [Nitrososphaerota archaeon]|nr:hypothetical protein [Nitrososphaerota archaeon]
MPSYPTLSDEEARGVLADLETYVRTAIANAPFHFRLGAQVLGGLLRTWLKIATMPVDQSLRTFESVAPPLGAIVRLYRSLVVLRFYDHPLVESKLGVEISEDRRNRFRRKREVLYVGDLPEKGTQS